MSEASRRKQAVCARAGRGVVGRCVVKKVASHAEFGVRDFVAVSWADIWAAGSDIALDSQQGGCPSLLNALLSATIDSRVIEIIHESYTLGPYYIIS